MKKLIIALLAFLLFFGNTSFAKAQIPDNSALLQQIAALQRQISYLQQILTLTNQINELKMGQIENKINAVADIAPAEAIAGIADNFKLEACEKRDAIYLEAENNYNRVVKMANISNFDFNSLCSNKTIPCLLEKYEKLAEYCELNDKLCSIKPWVLKDTAIAISSGSSNVGVVNAKNPIYNQWDINNRKCKYGDRWENVTSVD
jgi:hypothetical protein